MILPEGAESVHTGRAWTGHTMEDECPCPQAPCGLVAANRASKDCEQHGMVPKTMRQGHFAADCPVKVDLADVVAQHAAYSTWDEIDDEGDRVWYIGCDGCDWQHELLDAPATDIGRHVADEWDRVQFASGKRIE